VADVLALWGASYDHSVVKLNFNGTSPGLPRRSSGDSKLRVKNLSNQYLAADVTVTVEDTTVPGARTDFLLSLDGFRFAASINLGDLPHNATSPVFWLRRVTASTAPVGAKSARLRVHAGSWVAPDL
jgi:hypothetical protein